MRSFLSSIPIGCLLRPSTRTLVQSAASSHRVAWASTSAQPAEAFPTETVPESSQVGEESAEELRRKAIKLYKELHRLGRDYPDPNYEFNKRLRRAFEKNSKTKDPAALQKQLELGEHIKKEVLALISLKKFRHLRRTYHPNEGPR